MQNTFNFQHKNNVNKQLEAHPAFLLLSHKLNTQPGALEFIFPLPAFWGHLQGIPPCNNLVCVGQRIAYTRENCQIVEEIWILQLVKKKRSFSLLSHWWWCVLILALSVYQNFGLSVCQHLAVVLEFHHMQRSRIIILIVYTSLGLSIVALLKVLRFK